MAPTRRILDYDYSAPGWYFLTVVSAGRAPLFGSLDGRGQVTCSPIGDLVREAWSTMPVLRPWIWINAFVIMPDHVHGLLRIHRAPDGCAASLHVVVNGFKGAVTRAARRRSLTPRSAAIWQRSYDVRFLVTQQAVARAQRYIMDNPGRAAASAAYQAATASKVFAPAAAHRAAESRAPTTFPPVTPPAAAHRAAESRAPTTSTP
ncbi:MAG TPA: transposase, partial [bacterium]